MISYLPVLVGVVFVFLCVGLLLARSLIQNVAPNEALIINKMKREPQVSFSRVMVVPIIHRAERMDLSVHVIEVVRRGKDGLICSDNIRVDVAVRFHIQVNRTPEDVLKIAQVIGCARASDINTLEELFLARFSEALKTVAKQFDFAALYTQRVEFHNQIIELIGRDLNGFILMELVIDELEQTPIELLDPNNILDAVGIRKVTAMTAAQNSLTNEINRATRDGEGLDALSSEAVDEATLRDAKLLMDFKGFESRRAVDVDALLPTPAEATILQTGRIALTGERLSLFDATAAEPVATLLLFEDWSAMLSRQPEDDSGESLGAISLTLRQRRPGVTLSVTLRAPLNDTLEDPEARAAALALPALSQGAFDLSGQEMRTLLAHLRFIMRQDGAEQWGV